LPGLAAGHQPNLGQHRGAASERLRSDPQWRDARLERPAGRAERAGPTPTRPPSVACSSTGTTAPIPLYLTAVGLAFFVRQLSIAIYALVALIWLIPDPRIESRLED